MHRSTMESSPDHQTSVFDPNYKGSTYAVKYLGIVDGTMGILSRKMAMQKGSALNQNSVY